MPVTKQKIQIQDTRSVAMVDAGQTPNSAFGGLFKVAAGAAAAQAEAYGRAFAAENTKKAEQLAKMQVFRTSVNGAPEMPEQLDYMMGRAAQATYDATMEDRFVHQMGMAIENQINESANANMYDMSMFGMDVEDRLALMVQDVPEEYRAAFQSIAADKFVSKSASIGHAQAKIQQENDKATFPSMVANWGSQLDRKIALGQAEDAQSLMDAYIERINAQPSHILNDGEKAKFVSQMRARVGVSRVSNDMNLDGMNSRDLLRLYTSIKDPSDQQTFDFLQEYFPSNNEDGSIDQTSYDEKGRDKLGSHIQVLLQQAYQRENAERERTENAVYGSEVEAGFASQSPKAQKVLTGILSDQLSEYLIGADGQSIPLTPELWINGWFNENEDARVRAISQMKTSGFIDESLKKAFTRVANSNDTEEMANMLLTFRDLQEAPNRNQKVLDLSDQGFDRVATINEIALSLHGDGGSWQESVGEAMTLVNDAFDQQWNEQAYYNLLVSDVDLEGNFFGSNRNVTPETFRPYLREWMEKQLGNEFGSVGAQELEDSLRVFETYMRANSTNKGTRNDTNVALEFTLQSMRGRFVESMYMKPDGDKKHAYAPEKYYAEPMAKSVGELLKRWVNDGRSSAASALKWFNPLKLFPGDLPEEYWFDNATDRIGATPFQLLADKKIREHLGDELEAYTQDWNLLRAGQDYQLVYNKASGVPPTYFVEMIDQGSGAVVRVPDFVLDVRSEWEELTGFNITHIAVEALADQAFKDESNYEYYGMNAKPIKTRQQLYNEIMEERNAR